MRTKLTMDEAPWAEREAHGEGGPLRDTETRNRIAAAEHPTHSEIIREALNRYVE